MLAQPGVPPAGGELLPLDEDVAGVGLAAGGGRQHVVVLDDRRDGGGLARRHLTGLDEKHGPAGAAFPLLPGDPRGGFGLILGQAGGLVPLVDVHVDAEVEERHGHERREELERGGAEKEVPGEVKLCEALMGRDDALANDRLPEDDGGTVEEEC